jgi:hypothetical protein
LRRSLPYIGGVISFTLTASALLFDETRHQVGKLQQIGNPQPPPSLAEDDLWVRCHDIRPRLRHRADLILLDAQQEPLPVPVVPLTNADKLPSGERVERVHHAHKARAPIRRARSSC